METIREFSPSYVTSLALYLEGNNILTLSPTTVLENVQFTLICSCT